MGRIKQATPQRRAILSEEEDDATNGVANGSVKRNVADLANGHVKTKSPAAAVSEGNFTELVICVGGIYMSL